MDCDCKLHVAQPPVSMTSGQIVGTEQIRGISQLRCVYASTHGRTHVERVYEAGSLRLRHPKDRDCQGVIVNTAGGVAGGDQLSFEFEAGPNAAVTLTSTAAEKIYRSDGDLTRIGTRIRLAPESRLAWIPQETIVFDGARVSRHFDVSLADNASLVAVESLVFGRTASGERTVAGSFHDSWRVRRGGKLVFADETRLAAPIDTAIASPAVANGAHCVALILIVAPEATDTFESVRDTIDASCRVRRLEGAASLKDGIIIARVLGWSSEDLRRSVSDVLAVGSGFTIPRVWQ